MGKEIERKFLVDMSKWQDQGDPVLMVQGYLVSDDKATVRVRIAGNKAFLTIKSRTTGISRDEFEYEIPVSDAAALLKLAKYQPVEKVRWRVHSNGHLWEVDVFKGMNEGLVMAEVELKSDDEKVVLPDWVGLEVSSDARYFNSYLAKRPYSTWKDTDF